MKNSFTFIITLLFLYVDSSAQKKIKKILNLYSMKSQTLTGGQ